MGNRPLLSLAVCLLGAASLLLQGCMDMKKTPDPGKLCGSWTSVDGKPDVLI